MKREINPQESNRAEAFSMWMSETRSLPEGEGNSPHRQDWAWQPERICEGIA